jgi:hypothetical protein
MNPWETKDRSSKCADLACALAPNGNPKDEDFEAMAGHFIRRPLFNWHARARELAQAASYVELPCEECGGSGFDPGGIDPWGPEPCPLCRGAGTQKVTKNYLAEALRIAGNPECTVPVERAHLVAIVQYCRQVVSAAMCRPKAPALKRGPVFSKAARHRRRAARTRKVIQIERRKRDVEIRPQRT